MASDDDYGPEGAFMVWGPKGTRLRIIGSIGEGWEHVSVSIEHRIPNWEEMCFVKDLFWEEEETVAQYHPRRSAYVNCHPHCLHLWKPMGMEYDLPGEHLIGPKSLDA